MYDETEYECIVKNITEEIKPGELLYADFTINYKLKGRIKSKDIRQGILSRPYESNWPKIEKGHIGISRWITKKDQEWVSDVCITSVKIRARTGYINKIKEYKQPVETTKRRVVEDWEKQTRLDNGTFV